MRAKVVKAAQGLGLDVSVTTLGEPTRTVSQAATAVGCEERQIAKSIVFVADGEPVLVVASGEHRVNTGRLADVLDAAEIRTATEDEVCAATGFAVGGVAPFGHDLPVIFDRRLLDEERIYAAGGDGNTLFEVDPKRLAECTRAQVAHVGDGAAPEPAA
jgi:prolyl-tRNA editing enzyme YbaK/EbsC (Cys-tRNA(Pro) deacylase)